MLRQKKSGGKDKIMDFKKYQLFINGKNYHTRGLDLAFNPHSGNVLGNVVLVSESLLHEKAGDDSEETVTLPFEEFRRD
ncbi:MAG TPA: hypothetical protein DF383_12830 [Deltaproteobacteria bacterium]|nr:hypothetical protein [Deltaproteobacteria bacterium]